MQYKKTRINLRQPSETAIWRRRMCIREVDVIFVFFCFFFLKYTKKNKHNIDTPSLIIFYKQIYFQSNKKIKF